MIKTPEYRIINIIIFDIAAPEKNAIFMKQIILIDNNLDDDFDDDFDDDSDDDNDSGNANDDDGEQVRSQVDSGNSRLLGDYKGRFIEPEEVSTNFDQKSPSSSSQKAKMKRQVVS